MLGALIIAITLALQNKSTAIRKWLSLQDTESFGIQDHFKDKFRLANAHMRRFGTTEEPAAWDEFLKASQDLKTWIDDQAGRLTNANEKATLKKLDSAWEAYMRQAQIVRRVAATNPVVGVTLAEYNDFTDQSRKFLDLGQDLARAHYESRNLGLAQAHRLLTDMRYTVLVLVALLLLFGLALALTVYRNLIAPLRVRLAQSEQLAHRNEKLASLGLLAAGVAHEIRNPLTAIKTAAFSQQKRFPQGSPQRADGEIIEHEVSRLERIVNEFLHFARPARPNLTPILADEPLREVEILLAPQLAQSNIQLVREPSGPLAIRADAAQLKQVLINLVQNAAESIERGGTIWLRSRHGRKRLGDGEREVVVLEVADTGRGISPEAQKRLFDPFFSTKEKGTGLGLAIASRIVELHGGALQYQTEVNRGSTFGIILPRVPTVDGE
ncbi:MAG: hypothetical protein C5B50_28720 [Verrucomicrobia bacterium]|nr:MAG: hypothetical protein C5B50_28720 [Verrucomicrobiota bacterium]